MSVCFFVPADQGGASGVAAEVETEGGEDVVQTDNTQMNLQQFWTKVTDDIKKVTTEDFKMQPLPLARIKKIMKLDEEVKMISAEAPVLFAKAAEIFIHELTLRAWSHTEDNKRRTLQRNDIAMAISKSDQFDFLIDIVPRHEVKPSKPREEPPRPSPATDQLAQQHQAALQATTQPQIVVQPCAQVVQSSSAGSSSNNVVSAPQPVTLVQQVLTPSGELQQLPIQLSQAQLNMIRLQIQNNPGQAIIIQGQPQQTPQIIQVSSQAPHQPQQVFLAQVANSQEES
ncbi:nuclear transcription factor Y subunit gamma isoform X2 [Galleria mellonella]|uniref:Nuclear transcription factor Y subunit gamma n=1 Tax=Galleria mellonella TaxID=7137 RepID=A0A6J1WBN3_GALME|nr:nuclear transcription factor Y subunit gamma isoform X2 [Galleria mellonella]